MFISQQFLQNVLGYSTLEAGAAFLPAVVFMVLVAPRSAKLVESHGARFTLLVGLRLPAARVPVDAAALGGGRVVLADRHRLRLPRDRGRLRRHPGLPLADRVGAGPAGGHGLGHGGPPARPGRRDHAVDLRRAAHRGLRLGGQRRDRGVPAVGRRHRTACRTSSPARSPAPPTRPSSTRSTPTGSSRARSRPSSTATSGPTRPASIAVLVGAALVFFMFPHRDEEQALLERFAAEDGAEEPPGVTPRRVRPGGRSPAPGPPPPPATTRRACGTRPSPGSSR